MRLGIEMSYSSGEALAVGGQTAKGVDMYKKTTKTAQLRQPRNYWISRRVWSDEDGKEYVKINGMHFALNWLILHGWDVNVVF